MEEERKASARFADEAMLCVGVTAAGSEHGDEWHCCCTKGCAPGLRLGSLSDQSRDAERIGCSRDKKSILLVWCEMSQDRSLSSVDSAKSWVEGGE